MSTPYSERLEAFVKILRRRRLDSAAVIDRANVRALTGIDCDNACLTVTADGKAVFHSDFRYLPMARRVAPDLEIRDLAEMKLCGRRIGFEATISVARFRSLEKLARKAKFVDVSRELLALRAVKMDDEVAAMRKAVALNDRIWQRASAKFRPGMTELEMARIIRTDMVRYGDGEAFETIVSVGRNAAECHHVPDETVWTGRECVLVDMGVKLGGYCSDMTRNLAPMKGDRVRYRKIYDIVLKANLAAIAAARPGVEGRVLDEVARSVIRKAGYAKAFGHALGHGVGLEIHEAPVASKTSDWTLAPGMLITIEPGIYLEGELGVRIEDLVLITESGCEVLSASSK